MMTTAQTLTISNDPTELRIRRRIGVVGNCPTVYLSQRIGEAAHLKIGDEVDIYIDDNKIIIDPYHPKKAKH
jgi:antitoxin component of MazEF toxin-antitoxin module